jgi:hypothetical protein
VGDSLERELNGAAGHVDGLGVAVGEVARPIDRKRDLRASAALSPRPRLPERRAQLKQANLDKLTPAARLRLGRVDSF